MKYCIIGSGIGGGTLAIKLIEKIPDAQVILVEAGGFSANNNVKYENSGLDFKLRATRAIEVGGTSNLWHGVLSKLDPIDFEKRDWVKNSGWPININDLNEYYKEASEFFGVTNFEYFEESELPYNLKNELHNIDYNESILENKLFQQPLPTVRLKNKINELVKSSKNIELLTHCTALKFNLNDSNKIKSLSIGIDDGKIVEVEANYFIAAAGALETPRLLLNSKLDNKNIGKYLMDHPMGNLCQMSFKNPKKAALYSDYKINKNSKIKTGLVFRKDYQEKNELLNHNFFLRPSFKKGINDESEKIKLAFLTFLSGKIYPKDIIKLFSNPNVLLQILTYKFTFDVTYKFADLFFVTEQVPSKDSYVGLSNQKDKWDIPIADVHWTLNEQDLHSMEKIYSLILNDSFNKNLYEFTHEEKDIDWQSVYTSAAHHVGTARMGDSASKAVVDKDLRYFDVNNLFVCDGSVFPTSGNVNSGLTIGALACRLAKYLEKLI